MDWSLPDDFHTRNSNEWVSGAFSKGLSNGFREGLLEEIDPLGIRDMAGNFAMSGKGKRFPGDFVPGSKAMRKIFINGVEVIAGAGHHAFMRFFTRWKKHVSEILVPLPPPIHREYHTHVDRFSRAKVPNLPSIWDKGGQNKWSKFMNDYPGGEQKAINDIIAAQRQATIDYINMKASQKPPVIIQGLLEAFDEAIR